MVAAAAAWRRMGSDPYPMTSSYWSGTAATSWPPSSASFGSVAPCTSMPAPACDSSGWE